MNARAITWPTVPKGKDRVRVCLHSGNTKEEVEGLALALVEWARNEREVGEREPEENQRCEGTRRTTTVAQSKL